MALYIIDQSCLLCSNVKRLTEQEYFLFKSIKTTRDYSIIRSFEDRYQLCTTRLQWLPNVSFTAVCSMTAVFLWFFSTFPQQKRKKGVVLRRIGFKSRVLPMTTIAVSVAIIIALSTANQMNCLYLSEIFNSDCEYEWNSKPWDFI